MSTTPSVVTAITSCNFPIMCFTSFASFLPAHSIFTQNSFPSLFLLHLISQLPWIISSLFFSPLHFIHLLSILFYFLMQSNLILSWLSCVPSSTYLLSTKRSIFFWHPFVVGEGWRLYIIYEMERMTMVVVVAVVGVVAGK